MRHNQRDGEPNWRRMEAMARRGWGRLQAGMENGEPPHRICANCYQNGKKAILQTASHLERGYRVYSCPSCKTGIAMDVSEPFEGDE